MPIIISYEQFDKHECQKWLVKGILTDSEYFDAFMEMDKHRDKFVAVIIEVEKGVTIRGNFFRWLRTVSNSTKPIPTFIYGDLKNRWVEMALSLIQKIGVVTRLNSQEDIIPTLDRKFASK